MIFNQKFYLFLSSAFGLSLATLSMYYLYRKYCSDEWSDSDPRSDEKKTVFKVSSKRFQRNERHIRVPIHLVPKIIGYNGENIKDIERRTETCIHFERKLIVTEDVLNEDNPQVMAESVGDSGLTPDDWIEEKEPKESTTRREYRNMSIRGDEEKVCAAEQLVRAMIADNNTETVSIPYGCNIVGADGQTINQITDQSGARLKIVGSRYAHKRSVLITGTDRQRNCAKQLIDELIRDSDHN